MRNRRGRCPVMVFPTLNQALLVYGSQKEPRSVINLLGKCREQWRHARNGA